MRNRAAFLAGLFSLSALACPALHAQPLRPAKVASGPAAEVQCAPDAQRSPLTGLCFEQTLALLPDPAPGELNSPKGCDWSIGETAYYDRILLYRSLACGDKAARLEVRTGNEMSEIVYLESAFGDVPDPESKDAKVIARMFAGLGDVRSGAEWEARSMIASKLEAEMCALKRPYTPLEPDLPVDALIVDTGRSEAEALEDDAKPLCGTYGYNPMGGSIAFWRTEFGEAWYFTLSADRWDVDPASFTMIERNDRGDWQVAPSPPAKA